MDLKKALEGVKQNDHTAMEEYLYNRFGPKMPSWGNYSYQVSATCDIEDLDNLDVIEKMFQKLEKQIKGEVCIPFIMVELLPNKFGVEIWMYEDKESEQHKLRLKALEELADQAQELDMGY